MDNPMCSFEGCQNRARAKKGGWCPTHCERDRLGKPMDAPIRRYNQQAPALAAAGLRVCSVCNLTKPFDEFHKQEWLCKLCSTARSVAYKRAHPEYNREQVQLWRARHPEKAKEVSKKSAKRHPDTRRAWNLKALYDLTPEQVAAMLVAQGGVCAVCGTDTPGGRGTGKTWRVDHDHTTGAVRGLLCNRCNRCLGLLNDDPKVLRSAADYLERHRPPQF